MEDNFNLRFKLNGKVIEILIPSNLTLLQVLRNKLNLTGTKEGCGEGECGACSVLLDDKVVPSCLVPAVSVQDREVITIEGLSQNGELHPVQKAFIETGAVQCGFCTPGMIMASVALLKEKPNPTEQEIKIGLSGNLCRCTGYQKIIEAVKMASNFINSNIKN